MRAGDGREGGRDSEGEVDVEVVTLAAEVVAAFRLPRSTTAADVRARLRLEVQLESEDSGPLASEAHLVFGAEIFVGGQRLESLAEPGAAVRLTLVRSTRVALPAVSGSRGGVLRLWDVEARSLLREFRAPEGAGPATCVAAHWPARRALCGYGDGALRLWDLESGAVVGELPGHAGAVACVAVDWQSFHALSGGEDAALVLWDLEYCEAVRELRGHRGSVTCLAWDAALGQALSGSLDCTIRLSYVKLRFVCYQLLATGTLHRLINLRARHLLRGLCDYNCSATGSGTPAPAR